MESKTDVHNISRLLTAIISHAFIKSPSRWTQNRTSSIASPDIDVRQTDHCQDRRRSAHEVYGIVSNSQIFQAYSL